MTRQSRSPNNGGPRQQRRRRIWALVAAVVVALLYLVNAMITPSGAPADVAAQATAATVAEGGIPALVSALESAEADTPAGSEVTTEAEITEEAAASDVEASEPAAESAEVAEIASEASPTDTPAPTATPIPTNTPRPANTPTRALTQVPAQINGLPTILYDDLPDQAKDTIDLIDQGGPFPFDRDGITFQNREGLLPQKPRGYYSEYTVITPGSSDRGARRIVEGDDGELYYTDDHYESFSYVVD